MVPSCLEDIWTAEVTYTWKIYRFVNSSDIHLKWHTPEVTYNENSSDNSKTIGIMGRFVYLPTVNGCFCGCSCTGKYTIVPRIRSGNAYVQRKYIDTDTLAGSCWDFDDSRGGHGFGVLVEARTSTLKNSRAESAVFFFFWAGKKGRYLVKQCDLDWKSDRTIRYYVTIVRWVILKWFMIGEPCSTVDGRNPAPVDMYGYVVGPIIYKTLKVWVGAGFLPSTVCCWWGKKLGILFKRKLPPPIRQKFNPVPVRTVQQS